MNVRGRVWGEDGERQIDGKFGSIDLLTHIKE